MRHWSAYVGFLADYTEHSPSTLIFYLTSCTTREQHYRRAIHTRPTFFLPAHRVHSRPFQVANVQDPNLEISGSDGHEDASNGARALGLL